VLSDAEVVTSPRAFAVVAVRKDPPAVRAPDTESAGEFEDDVAEVPKRRFDRVVPTSRRDRELRQPFEHQRCRDASAGGVEGRATAGWLMYLRLVLSIKDDEPRRPRAVLFSMIASISASTTALCSAGRAPNFCSISSCSISCAEAKFIAPPCRALRAA